MSFASLLKQSVTALRANKLRSAFSVLGIVIGVAAVVMILSLGQSLKGLVTNEIEAMGPNLLDIALKVPGTGQLGTVASISEGIKVTTLKRSDLADLKDAEKFPYITGVTGQAFAQEWVVYQNKEKQILVYGCSPDYPIVIKTAKLAQGRFFTETEEEGLAKVAVLGNGLAEDLFGGSNPLGAKIKVKGQNFKVVGVLQKQGGIAFGGVDVNDFLYAPLKVVMKEMLGIDYMTEIVLAVQDASYFPRAIAEIGQVLRRNHNISDPARDDFQITTMTEILSQVNEISVILNLLLGFLAAISLLVGGVGIMNIMLVSVSERTREIGLRKSLGASSRDILRQFLVEGLIITGLGGLIGVVVGVGNSVAASVAIRSQGLSDWPLVISWPAIALALAVSVAIGLIFGIYPARKAARLDPIRALRKE